MGKKASSFRKQVRRMQREAKNELQKEARKNKGFAGYTGRFTQLANGDVVPQKDNQRKIFQGQLDVAKGILNTYNNAKSS